MNIKKWMMVMAASVLLLVLAAGCAQQAPDENNAGETNEGQTDEQNNEGENAGEGDNAETKGTIKFGLTSWSSTAAPTNIAKLLLQEAGYEVEFVTAQQPAIFSGLKNEDLDFFMDAWLPHTEAELWSEYENDLQKVSASYTDAPLGWVVPSYVEEDTIPQLKGNAEKFDGRIVGIGSGAGITKISQEMIDNYELTNYEVVTSSEQGMLAEAKRKMDENEPIVFMSWRPHSMFAQFDLKFLEDPQKNFKADNVYVISYNGVEEKHPEAYDILSRWSMEIADLEEMMLAHEQNDTPFSELAQEWVNNNPEKVDEILGRSE